MIYALMIIAILVAGVVAYLLWRDLNTKPEITFEHIKAIAENQNELYALLQRLVPPSTEIGGSETANQQSEVEAVESGNGQVKETEDTAPNLPEATKPWEELSHKDRMALVRAGIKKSEYEAMLKEG